MKLLKTSMAILFAASLLTACGGKDKKDGETKEPETKTETADSGPATKLEGAWEIKRAEGAMDSLNLGTCLLYTSGNDRCPALSIQGLLHSAV